MKKKSLTGSLPPPKRSFAAICLAREQALSILTCLCLPRLQTLGIIHGFTFCFADCVSSACSISLLLFWDIFFRRLFFRPMPQCVHFLTCLCKTTVPDTTAFYCTVIQTLKKLRWKRNCQAMTYLTKVKESQGSLLVSGMELWFPRVALDFVRESERNEKVVLR